MKKRSMISGVLACAIAACAGGCVVTPLVPMGSDAQDSAAKAFSAKPGVSSLYVYREESIAAGYVQQVLIDGKLIGGIDAETFIYVDLSPGKHRLDVRAKVDSSAFGQTTAHPVVNSDDLEFVTEAGKLYFVWVEIKTDVTTAIAPRVWARLRQVSEDEGRKGVRRSRLAIPPRW